MVLTYEVVCVGFTASTPSSGRSLAQDVATPLMAALKVGAKAYAGRSRD